MSKTASKDHLVAGGWRFVACMPQLQLETAIELEQAIIVPHNDSRLLPIVEQAPVVKRLLAGFRCSRGQPIKIASFLLNAELLERPHTHRWELVANFRNAVAIASISQGWQRTTGGPNICGTLFSDYFDFHSAIPSPDGKRILIESPSLNKIDVASDFFGQLSPDLPETRGLNRPDPDKFLIGLFKAALDEKYLRRRNNWILTALFRSLAYAFRAARMPKGCDSQLFDFGINLGLWQAAFECLVRPENPDMYSDKQLVFNLLGKRHWDEPSLQRKIPVRVSRKGKPLPLNYVQRLYNDIRVARNDFLHGNRVGRTSIVDRRKMKVGILTNVAPLVYHVAIEQFIKSSRIQIKDTEEPLNPIADYFFANQLPEALITFLKGNKTN